MLLSAVSVLVIVLQSSEILEGLMNNPVYLLIYKHIYVKYGLTSGGLDLVVWWKLMDDSCFYCLRLQGDE
jgi:hypothetical protein